MRSPVRFDPLYVIPFAAASVEVLAALTAFPRGGRPRTPTEISVVLRAFVAGAS